MLGDLYPKRRNEWKLKLGSLNIKIRYDWYDEEEDTRLICLIRPFWLYLLSFMATGITIGFTTSF